MKHITLLSATTLSSLLLSTAVLAETINMVTWTFGANANQHTYEIVKTESPISWTQAKLNSEAKGGYLATITSAEENAFVFNNLANQNEFWIRQLTWGGSPNVGPYIGAFMDNNQWQWVTGETWSYANWGPGLPDNFTNFNEFYAHLFIAGSSATSDQWNDVGHDGGNGIYSYIVEYDQISAVPIPTAALLFAPALIGFTLLRRKQPTKNT
jgi:hypothetical protein